MKDSADVAVTAQAVYFYQEVSLTSVRYDGFRWRQEKFSKEAPSTSFDQSYQDQN
jgi:hypothetical protein